MANGYEDKSTLYPPLQTPVDPDARDPNDMNKHLRVRKKRI
jgi:hypothetical protein